jgi:hypothetical protein
MKANKSAKELLTLHLNLKGEWFAKIAAKTKRIEYRLRTPYWKTRLENRQYDVIQFRNGYATNAPEMLVEFCGISKVKKWGENQYAIRLGKIIRIKRWRNK